VAALSDWRHDWLVLSAVKQMLRKRPLGNNEYDQD
jgi:hypothetical protein